MVKNFQGAQIETKKSIEVQAFSVKDHMATRLITFRPDQSIHEVVHKLLENNISGAPIVNDKNQLVGIISEGDCLKDISSGKYHDLPLMHGRVEDLMAKNVIHIRPDVSIFEAAEMFLEYKLRRFPVLDENGKLVGQISQRDIMKAVSNIKR